MVIAWLKYVFLSLFVFSLMRCGQNVLVDPDIFYLKSFNIDSQDYFGTSVSLSGDGTMLAVGAPGEDSNSNTINGDELNDSVRNTGAVYIFSRLDTIWQQQSYIKSSNSDAGDLFGTSVSLSKDSLFLAVGAPGESGGSTTNQDDNSRENAGAVYIFSRSGTTWRQQSYIKSSNSDAGDLFGTSVSLSNDGATLIVGAPEEDGAVMISSDSSTGEEISSITTNTSSNEERDSGAVYVFGRNDESWSQQAYIKAQNAGAGDLFGSSTALSGDGSFFIVGAPQEDSFETGINSNGSNNASEDSGAAYIFRRSSTSTTTWNFPVYLKVEEPGNGDLFGSSLSIDSNGSIAAVGAPSQNGNIDSSQDTSNADFGEDSGAVYTFIRATESENWTASPYIKASNTNSGDSFGSSVSLNADGTFLVIGACLEQGNSIGANGNLDDNSFRNAGAIYTFDRSSDNSWGQNLYLKPLNTGIGDQFGFSVSSDNTGNVLSVGSVYEDSSSGSSEDLEESLNDNMSTDSGAAYVYEGVLSR